MILILMRHGVAEDSEPDESRILTQKGAKRVMQAAKVLRRLDLYPDVFLSSFRVRAVQTADTVRNTLNMKDKIERIGALDFAATWEDFAAVVNARVGELDSGAIVFAAGHQPSIGRFVSAALTGTEQDMEIKKGAFVVIQFEEEARAGAGVLEVAMTAGVARSV